MNKTLFDIVSRGSAVVRSRPWLKTAAYAPLELLMRRRFSTLEYALYSGRKYKKVKVSPPPASEYAADYPWTIGVIRDLFYDYESYIMACRELKVAYKTIDLFATDWVDQVSRSGCDAFVVFPGECLQEWKRMYDERLRFLSVHMQRLVYPSYDALWIYGCKERMRDWLDIHGFPHAKTWVFYDREEALSLVADAQLPLVIKLDIGATAKGVWIVKTREKAVRLIRQAFGKGLMADRTDARMRQWLHIMIQEYEPQVREWRIIRLGDTYHGHEKLPANGYHSGSGAVGWVAPPQEALELAHRVTEAGNFRSMDVDMFQRPDGKLLINELQAVFGATFPAQTYIDGVPGYYTREDGKYVFHEGCRCQNSCCNLRILDLLSLLKKAHS